MAVHVCVQPAGDVLGLRDASDTLVVQYRYDAWGKQISKSGTLASTLGTANPFRYRGYIYDEEIELYYLQTRYYSPYRGRFISPDSLLGKDGGLLQHNLFCYCGNSPIGYEDINGQETIPWYEILSDITIGQLQPKPIIASSFLPTGDPTIRGIIGKLLQNQLFFDASGWVKKEGGYERDPSIPASKRGDYIIVFSEPNIYRAFVYADKAVKKEFYSVTFTVTEYRFELSLGDISNVLGSLDPSILLLLPYAGLPAFFLWKAFEWATGWNTIAMSMSDKFLDPLFSIKWCKIDTVLKMEGSTPGW